MGENESLMPHVPYVQREQAPNSSKDILESFESEHGKRSLLLEALANHPPLLEAHSQYFDKTITRGSLDRTTKELVGVVVSRANECEYCVDSHRSNLVEMFGVPRNLLEAVENDNLDAFSERRRAMLEFAEAASTEPTMVGSDEFDALRESGLDDGEIVELLGAVGQFAVANLYADALSIHPTHRDS